MATRAQSSGEPDGEVGVPHSEPETLAVQIAVEGGRDGLDIWASDEIPDRAEGA